MIIKKTCQYGKYKDLDLYLKREPNSCFANNYFYVGLKTWKANMF